jgi:hypothetical protein
MKYTLLPILLIAFFLTLYDFTSGQKTINVDSFEVHEERYKKLECIFAEINKDKFTSQQFRIYDEAYITVCLDSLDYLYTGGELPFFLSDYKMDCNADGWPRPHYQPFSIRKMLIDNTCNIKTLKAICKSKNKNYDKTRRPSPDDTLGDSWDIPFQELSIRQLAKQRLIELRKLLKRKSFHCRCNE